MTEKRKRRGPQPHEPTEASRAKVTSLKAFGHTTAEVAAYLGMSEDSIERHYKAEIKSAAVDANLRVANALYKKATEQNDTTAQIFWLKTRARWREYREDRDPKDTLIEKLLDRLE